MFVGTPFYTYTLLCALREQCVHLLDGQDLHIYLHDSFDYDAEEFCRQSLENMAAAPTAVSDDKSTKQ
jgi:hypothetical protein